MSAISALAEFDGAILRLFRNMDKDLWTVSQRLMSLPSTGSNTYTVTLYDLPTMTHEGCFETTGASIASVDATY